MTEPHRIRLRGPWDFSCGTQQATYDWRQLATIATAAEQPLVGRRLFGRPTGIAAGDRVDLVLSGLSMVTAVSLNNLPLNSAGNEPQRYVVTDQLQPRNELQLTLAIGCEFSPDYEVRLEIFSPHS